MSKIHENASSNGIKRFFDCAIETETCNLRCSYCYVTQQRRFNNKLVRFSHTPEEIRQALSKKRLGGGCLFNMCAGGETLLSPDVLLVAKELLKEGHFVSLITNGTLTRRFEEIAEWPSCLKGRLFIKFSYHFLELRRLGWTERFFKNIALMKIAGVSFTVELTPCDELEQYTDEIKAECMENLGALCHVTIARDDRTGGIEHLSKHSFDKYKEIWGVFDSALFDFKSAIFYQRRKEFCYAGEWSAYLNLTTGDMRQCYCGEVLCNIFKDMEKPLAYKAVGRRCSLPHCYNGHSWLALGVIPELDAPTYAEERNRRCVDGSEWLQPLVLGFFSTKLYDANKEYGLFERTAKYSIAPFLKSNYRRARRVPGRIKKWRAKKTFESFLTCSSRKKALVVGSPLHTNLGDSAICLAEIMFLESCGLNRNQIKEITVAELSEYSDVLQSKIQPSDLICGLGGGNMGNQWPGEDEIRYKILRDYPENNVIVFPQTVFFIDKDSKTEDVDMSIKSYCSHKKLKIFAREQVSLSEMKTMYQGVDIEFAPDIVLSASAEQFGVRSKSRNGVLLCFRSDAERNMDENARATIVEYVQHLGCGYANTDMHAKENVTKVNRAELVRRKMQEFADSELVITDRLHGMIFAALTGTPCIVFGNYNHKVKGTYDLISYLPYIKFANSSDEAIGFIPGLLEMKNCEFDNGPLRSLYNGLESEIKNNLEGQHV